ncbi:efflux RND transporter periplasmic adaptor subunit [Gloeobacter kilaueensis]|uniref:RND family efflux transporter MFP subunit n=1 Tax=Gloeobacter kilaueensis (strain ATCC BAA-2537 / CCAP 1431/1 / ULC 316 / JS1) TaxID=1183438 RepID=U5QH73_GLOK1|nr:efflux RND transporter periplasmic adaptor subunit [Gloeobacter kilaueensis]AGY58291.1 RND family efflux transporter MFP subunit [Gloeobacter kilaueensis JS1]
MEARGRVWFLAAVVVLALAVPAGAHGGHDDAFEQHQAAEAVRVAPDVQKAMGLVVRPVQQRLLSSGLAVNGKIEAIPSHSADVNAPLAGRVLALYASRAQAVRTGQVLATLDSPEIRQLAVEAARSRVQARTAFKQAEARLALAEANYQREKDLLTKGISARRDFQLAEAERNQVRADREAARAQVQLADALLKSRLSQLGQRGVSARADGIVALAAPVAGVVAEQRVTAGEAVEPGKPLYKIIDLTAVWATAAVYEKDLAQVRPGEPVEVSVAAYPNRTFRGRVASVDPAIDADTRTLGVRAILANPDGQLKPGMFATLRLVTGRASRAVAVIPRTAVIDADGQKLVYVQKGEAFVPTEVQLGRTDGEDLIEVKDGLAPGDRVVTQRAFQLRAQALKGSLAAEESASGQVSAENSDSRPTAKADRAALPWWSWVVGGVLIAVGSFVAGVGVARRTGRPAAPAARPPAGVSSSRPPQR